MPTTPIRWLHLSDFHVGKDRYEERKIHNFIHDHVREQCDNGFIPDLIFITGDIANNGLENEYADFINEFLNPLKVALGGRTWEGQIFAIPGNHDLQRKYVKAVSREDRLRADSKFFRADKSGLEERRIHELRAFEEFGNFTILSDLWPENWLDSEQSSLLVKPFRLKGRTIGIVGVNTAWLSRDDKDKEQLSPGIDLLESTLLTIKDCDLRILLGHHPLDWLSSKHRNRVQNILGDHKIIYLHGHLHENRSQPMETGGGRFLQIQAGAAFNVLELDETKWENGLLWAEVDFSLTKIKLRPRYWKCKEGRWGIADDLHEDNRIDDNWWSFPLPNTPDFDKTVSTPQKNAQFVLPNGWVRVDEIFIEERSRREIQEETLLHFFDGAIPMWHQGFLHTIPQRNVVSDTIAIILNNLKSGRPSMTLLTGGGGEGKSTALLQSALALFEGSQCNLLWHTAEQAPLLIDSLSELPADKPWVVVSDDGDQMVQNLGQILPWLAQNRSDIHFLIAARKSDWFSAGGTRVGWMQHCLFREIVLGKLYPNEAQSIISLWSTYGEAGLKSLHGTEPDEAARRLQAASEDEQSGGEGAFLGAMLKIRLADGLKDHVKLLLSRLMEVKVVNGNNRTLLDAFAVIACMHAEGLSFLSEPVIAQYIYGDPTKRISGKILVPLGKEAAATHAGKFVFTRHTSIAQTAITILESDFGVDPGEIFINLGVAAIKARPKVKIPEFKKWEYDLPLHFLKSNRESIALAIGEAQLSEEPQNTFLLNNLASLYRETGDPEKSSHLFRKFDGATSGRDFYYEWGTAEGNAGNAALAVWLAAAALSDWRFSVPPGNNRSKLCLAGLGVAFESLYADHYVPEFRDARKAVGVLGLKLDLDPTAKRYLDGHFNMTRDQGAPDMDVERAIAAFVHGVQTAWSYLEKDESLLKRLPTPAEMTFEDFENFIRRAAARKG
ncbi:metallophosphoesterase [Geomonas sp. Red32]|uniref:metallophosphoesterase family protein n=1 Tax=Geomonas sp. Red32 TaxID=2912856 RepID=UPI00202D0296|nr:metallophosphoesterase [Geomonas sp. Red32]MCM0082967.1 metallophosphoesterase [Geomonas sp. Red32]